MLPGPDKVCECPKCKGLLRVFTLISGNTIGARRWTDGKMIAPMLPTPPAITRCPYCGHYYWISESKVVGELPLWGDEERKVPSTWKTAERVRELSEAEYLEAIRIGAADSSEKELHLRICAWWSGNDPLRSQGPSPADQTQNAPTRSPEATMNLERLLELLDIRNPDQRLMKAELLREIGRFDDAIHLLDSHFPGEYRTVVALVRRLAQNRDSVVREILE